MNKKPYLRSIELTNTESAGEFPFNLPIFSKGLKLDFHPDVTFIVGENGSGKSTLLEAIAVSQGFNPEGGNKNVQFSTRDSHSKMHEQIKTIHSYAKPKDYYFLRAESFYNVASYMDDVRYVGGFGGKSLHNQSHGESFMALLFKKLKGNGLYIFDEPEAALSPNSQLAALVSIHELVKKDSQFVIATHSPILLAYPNALILQVTEKGFEEIKYEDTEHFQITRDFLNNYEGTLHHLLQ